MTIYRFSNNSLIDEVAVKHSQGGGVRAYIHAREDAQPEELEALQKALTEKSMKWAPIRHEGKQCLEVRSIGRDGHNLLRFLASEGATSGSYKKEVNPENQVKLKDKFRNNTLRLSGLFYTIGDLGFIRYGFKDSLQIGKSGKLRMTDPQNLFAGIFYAIGTPVITIFGKGDKSDIQLRHMSYDMLKHLENNGIKIPKDSSIHSITHKHNSNIWRKIISKCERYPAEITNSIYGLAGAMIVWAGVNDFGKLGTRQSSKSRTSILMDIGLGAMTILAGLVSVFVEEEPRKSGEPRKKGMAGAWQWVKEKPLRTAGILLGASTVSHAGSTIIAYQKTRKILNDNSSSLELVTDATKNKQALLGRTTFVVTNLAAEALMSISSKGHGEGVESDPSLRPSAYSVMADLIQRSPAEKRDKILDTASLYLSGKENLNISKEEIRQGIIQQIEDIDSNPWIGKANSKLSDGGEKSSSPTSTWRNLVTSQPELVNSQAL